MPEVIKVLHVMRSPVGGLFRHVRDLVREQSVAGLQVGVICDSSTGGDTANTFLQSLEDHCTLGIHRLPMPRLPGFGDVANVRKVTQIARQHGAQVLHGHGAKGGLYARLAARRIGAKSVYTPHGGSLHYKWLSPAGWAFLGMEWVLARVGGNNIFVCEFERSLYSSRIGASSGKNIVVHNGLAPEDFEIVPPDSDAADLLFVGEMRTLKGVDLLLEALATVPDMTLALVGSGPDKQKFQELSKTLGVEARAHFLGQMPMRDALHKGRVLVVPSRNESFPYVVLEAAAAGRTVLASKVGGIPEILPPGALFNPGSPGAISQKLSELLKNRSYFNEMAKTVRAALQQRTTTKNMSAAIQHFYGLL